MGRLFLVLSFLLVARTAPAAPDALGKLDPRTRAALMALHAGTAPERMIESRMAVSERGDLDVFIRGSVTRAELEALGVRVRTALPGLYTAYVPASAIESVASLASVRAIRGAAPAELELDASVPSTGANALRGPGPNFVGRNGAGVLIGDVDTGVDFDHGDFKDAAGKTRFISIWDQNEVGGAFPPPGYGYGADWRPGQLDSLVSTEVDASGHGTHVIGIAGGDGSNTGGAVPAFTYVGMAPKADLCMVNTNFNTTSILDGVAYIFGRATARNQPAVVNLSLGSHYGSHDGTDEFEAGLSALTGPGRIIIKSAGNDRGTARHAQVNAAGAGTPVTFTASLSSNGSVCAIDGYYESTENMQVKLQTPNGTVIGPLARGAFNAAYPGVSTPNGDVYLENGVTTTTPQGDFEVYAEISVGAGQNMNGTWTFTFIPITLGADNGQVDLWRYYSAGATTNFVTGNSPFQELISEPGNADSLITAAAWTTKTVWTGCNGTPGTFGGPTIGNLASFSSPGPTRDGRQKPDISAPGIAIGSATTFDLTQSCPASPAVSTLLPDGMAHTIQAGTSMAAPHVAGAVALIMQTEPTATPSRIKDILFRMAKTDGFTGTVWNRDWGHGKLFLDQVTMALVSLFEASTSGEGIELRWRLNHPASYVTVTLERGASASGPWSPIEAERREESGITVAIDRGAEAGRTYYYRLAVLGARGERYTFGPLSVTAGAPIAELALLPIAPNPATDEARIDFTVPRPMDVSLGVFDIQGREVAVLARGLHRAGRYQMAWSGADAPGLYFVRLATQGRVLTQRVAMIH